MRGAGGFYLGSIGGPAAILAKNSIKNVEVLEYPELMEAIWKIEVEDFTSSSSPTTRATTSSPSGRRRAELDQARATYRNDAIATQRSGSPVVERELRDRREETGDSNAKMPNHKNTAMYGHVAGRR